jgi:hypothetical protein
MKYKLYLDDARNLPDLDPEWRLARSYHDAVWYVMNYGLPYHVSFDHDLADVHYDNPDYGHSDEWMTGSQGKPLKVGGVKILTTGKGRPYEFTGYDFAKWFCQWVLDNQLGFDSFTYSVHSANPAGAENIRCYMQNFIEWYREHS